MLINVQYPYIYLLTLHPRTLLHLTQSYSIIIYSTIVYTLIYLPICKSLFFSSVCCCLCVLEAYVTKTNSLYA